VSVRQSSTFLAVTGTVNHTILWVVFPLRNSNFNRISSIIAEKFLLSSKHIPVCAKENHSLKRGEGPRYGLPVVITSGQVNSPDQSTGYLPVKNEQSAMGAITSISAATFFATILALAPGRILSR